MWTQRVGASLAAVCAVACSSMPAATTEFFGKAIEPPRGLDKLTPGMSIAEAERLVPGLHEPARAGVRDELVLDSSVEDVELKVRIDNGRVASIIAIAKGHTARELLEQAWGPPQITRDVLGQPEVTWADEKTGWKVKLDCIERNCLVEYAPYHAPTPGWLGSHVVPPDELANLRIGMKVAEARVIAPGPVDVRGGIPTGINGVRKFVSTDDKQGVVRAIYLNLPPHAETAIPEAWGESQPIVELGRPEKVWLDPATGWRATLREGLGASHDLAFENYIPAAQLLGEQPDKLDALPEPVLGQTVEDVKRAYKLDPAAKELAISLPPTEWEHGATRVALEVAAGHVKSLSFAIPYKAHPDARDGQLELFKHKWGDPRQVDEDGKPPTLVFRDADPRVEVVDDTERGEWRLTLK